MEGDTGINGVQGSVFKHRLKQMNDKTKVGVHTLKVVALPCAHSLIRDSADDQMKYEHSTVYYSFYRLLFSKFAH